MTLDLEDRGDLSEHTLWTLEGMQTAQCQDCGWQVDARSGSARVAALVCEHVESCSHEVHTTRQQVRRTRPAGWRQLGHWEPESPEAWKPNRSRRLQRDVRALRLIDQGRALAAGRSITEKAAYPARVGGTRAGSGAR